MDTLIIYAHPDTGGHNPAILGETIKQLKKHKVDYDLIDLYKINYDPVLHENEHYTRGNKEVSVQNKEFQNKISVARNLIFIYPVWWSSMPAILKGFVDRVFTGGFAFKYVNGKPVGLLKGKKAVAFITTGGAQVVTQLLQMSRPHMLFKIDLMYFVGIKAKVYQIGKANNFSKIRIPEIKNKVERGLDFLLS